MVYFSQAAQINKSAFCILQNLTLYHMQRTLERSTYTCVSASVCVFLYLLHTEYQNSHSTRKVRRLLGSEDIWLVLFLGLRLGFKFRKLVLRLELGFALEDYRVIWDV